MVIAIDPELEAALVQRATEEGLSPDALAIEALRQRFLSKSPIVPRDEWERTLLGAASHCGVSLSNEALSSEGLYD